MCMACRLRYARETAGYDTAATAIEYFNWPSRAYLAHENGHNKYPPTMAQLYASAFGVSPAWLLLGDEGMAKFVATKASVHKHNCIENIQIATLLLQADPNNFDLISMIETCATSLQIKAIRKLYNTHVYQRPPSSRVNSKR